MDRERDLEGEGEGARGEARRASAALTDRISSEKIRLGGRFARRLAGRGFRDKSRAEVASGFRARASLAGPRASAPSPRLTDRESIGVRGRTSRPRIGLAC